MCLLVCMCIGVAEYMPVLLCSHSCGCVHVCVVVCGDFHIHCLVIMYRLIKWVTMFGLVEFETTFTALPIWLSSP